MQTWLVGLDVGTTSSKAVVMAPDGREVASGRAPTPWTTTALGTQTGAEELVAAARSALSSAVAAARRGAGQPGRIVGVGVASMAESGVLLDRDGGPVAPVIAWHDTRDRAETDDLRAELGAEFSVRTGLPLRQQWSLTKHRWQLDHDEAAAHAVRRLGVAEWIVHALGGDQVSEQSLASRTGWLDLARRDWWDEALAWSGARVPCCPSWWPPVNRSAPRTTAGTCPAWPAPPSPWPVTTTRPRPSAPTPPGCTPSWTPAAPPRPTCARCPRGCPRPTSARSPTPGSPWAGMPCPNTGACSARPAAGSSCSGCWPCSDAAAPTSRRSTPPPWRRPNPATLTVTGADGSEVGLRHVGDDVDPARVWRAALTAAVDAGRDIHDAMTRASGAHQDLVVTGGWAHSTGVLTLKRRALGELRIPQVGEAGARGAALLAGSAAGVYATPADYPRPAALESPVAAR